MHHTQWKRAALVLPVIIMAVFLTLAASNIVKPEKAFAASTQEMYRLYNQNSGEHFYTASQPERNSLILSGWNYEGVAWSAPSFSNSPVYRLYSGTDHHYTMDAGERDQLVSVGWSDEGIGWDSDDAKSVPLYRQFNPNVQPWASKNNSGSHNYTTSKVENDKLVKTGWREEGIGWYGSKTSSSSTVSAPYIINVPVSSGWTLALNDFYVWQGPLGLGFDTSAENSVSGARFGVCCFNGGWGPQGDFDVRYLGRSSVLSGSDVYLTAPAGELTPRELDTYASWVTIL